MQYKLILAGAAVATLAACTPASVPPTGGESSSSSSSVITGESTSSAGSAEARIVDVVVTNWSFTPATVTVKKGEMVQLRLKGDQGIHGLQVADLGLNVRIEAGQETLVTVPTDKAGTFAGRCNIPCGPGHRDMTFSIVVE